MLQPDRYPCRLINSEIIPGFYDEVWNQAPAAGLVDVVTGGEPLLPTVFQWLRNDRLGCFFIRFEGKASERRSTFRLHDEPLWKQDVFELFLCDEARIDAYKEMQSSPWDVRFDGRISYDEKGRRHLDMSWDAKGWTTRTGFDKDSGRLISIWTLPYGALENKPKSGSSWRFGVFRVSGEELQAWQMTGAANFHVPERFGYLDFE